MFILIGEPLAFEHYESLPCTHNTLKTFHRKLGFLPVDPNNNSDNEENSSENKFRVVLRKSSTVYNVLSLCIV